MRITLTSFVIIVLSFSACKQKESQPENKLETPKALQEHKEGSYLSKRGDDNADLVESLYNELVEKNPELKKLETAIENLQIHKLDSTAPFEKFDQKNKSWYTAAKQHSERVKDSALRVAIQSIINKSDSTYLYRSDKYRTLINLIGSKQSGINDMHLVLKIVKTIPLIEKYQGESTPSLTSIEQVNKEADTIYGKIKKLQHH